MFRSKDEAEDLLLPVNKNCGMLFEQTHTR